MASPETADRGKTRSDVSGFDILDEIPARNLSKKSENSMYSFEQKHVFSMKNNPMCGVTLWQWLHIYIPRLHQVEIQYYPRALFITLISIFNSLLAFVESLTYASSIYLTRVPDDPVFIIGHPRTGTTLIHNLLASDDDSFYYCTTFCAGFPSCFLWFEEMGKRLFANVIENTRPMDSMPLHFELPQEDECATNLLSCGRSYYMPLWFMKQEPQFRKYLDFSQEDGGTADDEMQWISAFLHLMKKLTLRHNMSYEKMKSSSSSSSSRVRKHRLLIKSPIHTARVPLLRKLFPKAKFIYVHRNPYEVFQSAAHMANTAYWFCSLNTPTNEQIIEFILWQFKSMDDKYFSALRDKDKHNHDIIEIAYADICGNNGKKKQIEQLRNIYNHINIEWTGKLENHFENELKDLQGYRPNTHLTLSDDMRYEIEKRWIDYFERYEYEIIYHNGYFD